MVTLKITAGLSTCNGSLLARVSSSRKHDVMVWHPSVCLSVPLVDSS